MRRGTERKKNGGLRSFIKPVWPSGGTGKVQLRDIIRRAGFRARYGDRHATGPVPVESIIWLAVLIVFFAGFVTFICTLISGNIYSR